MIIVRLNDKYVAPLYANYDYIAKNGGVIDCDIVGCQYLDYVKENVCIGCNFENEATRSLEDVEVKFKFIEEEN